jgi:hypothetical protein
MPKAIVYTNEFYKCRLRGQSVAQTLEKFCSLNNVHFVKDLDESRVKSFLQCEKSKYMVMFRIQDPLLGDVDYWKKINHEFASLGKKLLVCTDNYVLIDDFSHIQFLSHKALIGLKSLHVNTDWVDSLAHNHSPKRLFNCFNHRVESVRQSWFYFLHNRKLLDSGYVSFLFYSLEGESQSELDLFEKNHNKFLNRLDHFNKAYAELKSQIPFRNFAENGVLWDKICDSKYSLVLDTAAPDDDQIGLFFSEKVARVLMLPSIDLLFLQKQTLHCMESMGLVSHTYSLGIDHMSWHDRQLNLLQALEKDDIQYDFKKLLDRARHNHAVLSTALNNMDGFFTEVFDTVTCK